MQDFISSFLRRVIVRNARCISFAVLILVVTVALGCSSTTGGGERILVTDEASIDQYLDSIDMETDPYVLYESVGIVTDMRWVTKKGGRKYTDNVNITLRARGGRNLTVVVKEGLSSRDTHGWIVDNVNVGDALGITSMPLNGDTVYYSSATVDVIHTAEETGFTNLAFRAYITEQTELR